MIPRKMIQAINNGDADALKDLLELIRKRSAPLDDSKVVIVEYWESPAVNYRQSSEARRRQWMHHMQQTHNVPLSLMEAFFAGDLEAREDLAEFVAHTNDKIIPNDVLNSSWRQKLMSLDQFIFELFFSETATKRQKKLIWEARDYIILDYTTEEWTEEREIEADAYEVLDTITTRDYRILVRAKVHIRKTIGEIIEPHILKRLGHLFD